MLNKKEYNRLMNENWAGLIFKKDYKDLNAAGKELVAKGIKGDVKHNDKDAKELIAKNKELYKKATLEDSVRRTN